MGWMCPGRSARTCPRPPVPTCMGRFARQSSSAQSVRSRPMLPQPLPMLHLHMRHLPQPQPTLHLNLSRMPHLRPPMMHLNLHMLPQSQPMLHQSLHTLPQSVLLKTHQTTSNLHTYKTHFSINLYLFMINYYTIIVSP